MNKEYIVSNNVAFSTTTDGNIKIRTDKELNNLEEILILENTIEEIDNIINEYKIELNINNSNQKDVQKFKLGTKIVTLIISVLGLTIGVLTKTETIMLNYLKATILLIASCGTILLITNIAEKKESKKIYKYLNCINYLETLKQKKLNKLYEANTKTTNKELEKDKPIKLDSIKYHDYNKEVEDEIINSLNPKKLALKPKKSRK